MGENAVAAALRGEAEFQQADAAAWGVDTYGDLPRTVARLQEGAMEINRLQAELDQSSEIALAAQRKAVDLHAEIERLRALVEKFDAAAAQVIKDHDGEAEDLWVLHEALTAARQEPS